MGRPGNEPQGERDLGFTFRLAEGVGTLALASRRFFGWLTVEALELALPERLAPRGDASPAPEVFQSTRTRARRARLRMGREDLELYVAGCGEPMAEVGVDELRVSIGDGSLAVSGRVREGAQVADLSLHVYLTAAGDRLRVTAAYPRIYGHLDTPAPLVAHRLLGALLRVGDGTAVRRRSTLVRGLGDFQIEPLGAMLFRTMPAAGWRLPATRGVPITGVRVRRGEVILDYGGDDDDASRDGSEAAAQLAAALDRFHGADELLRHGDLDGALRAYRGELAARGPDQPLLVERILAIASARRSDFPGGIELARQVLGRWPDFAPAHAALASIAVARGEVEAAAERYRLLAEASTAVGDEEPALRAALAGARLLRQFAPDQSTSLYELVLERRPGHPEASEALADRYRDEARWHDLVRLIRARLAHLGDDARASRDRIRLAAVLFEELGDVDAARDELYEACRLDPRSAPAFERLATVEHASGDVDAAVMALDTAAELYRDRGDTRAEGRCHKRAAEAMLERAPARADRLFHAALELDPADAEAMQGAARAAALQGRHGAAAALWRELMAAGTEAPAVQALYACELGRNLLADDRPDEARPPLERAADTGEPPIRAEAHALLAPLARERGDLDGAALHLAAAIDALIEADDHREVAPEQRERAAMLASQRAAMLREVARTVEAAAESRRAFALAPPGSATRAEAARSLLENGDTPERAWLDELLDAAEGPDERAQLFVARARLAAADPMTALEDVAAAIAQEPRDEVRSDALALKAELLAATGDAAGRADVLAERAELGGNRLARARAAVESAEGWLAAEDWARATRAARLALDALGGDWPELRARALAALGECAWRQRDWAGVDDAYRPLLAELPPPAPECARLAHRHGCALERLGRDDEAAALLAEVAAADDTPGDIAAECWHVLGDLHDRLGDVAAAAAALERYATTEALDLSDAARAEAWYRAGELYRKRTEHRDEAVRCLQESLRQVSDHLPALDALERLARDDHDFERVAVVLGRKIAATARHPQRQKALLCRLAALQEEKLDRVDVARETYRRVLELDPDDRTALRFAARDARDRGDHVGATAILGKLALPLAGDSDGPADLAALERERDDAAAELSSVLVATAGEGDDDAIRVLRTLADEREDASLIAGLEAVYRRRGDDVALAEVLGRKAAVVGGGQALAIDLERIEILRDRVGDAGAALVATRAAMERNPSAPALGVHLEALSGSALARAGKPAATPPAGDHDAILHAARAALEAGHWSEAARLFDGVDLERAPDSLLQVRADVLEGEGDAIGAAAVLERLLDRAAGDRGRQHALCRRLAALRLERLGDEGGARELYRRALELAPDDLVAAEVYADLVARTDAHDDALDARADVLGIARRTGAGPNEEARALRQLALVARRKGDLEAAASFLEEACELAPGEPEILRERIDLATALGHHEAAARWLEVLAEAVATGGDDASGDSAGDRLLELADLLQSELHDAAGARRAMRRAADAFGRGARRDATLRLLASEAAAAGADQEAAEAYEAIELETLPDADQLALAKIYQRLGREQAAIDVLEVVRRGGGLGEEGATLLGLLGRHAARKTQLARSLERGAENASPAVATTRLLEALRLYRDALGDREGAERARAELARIAPRRDTSTAPATVAELERAASDAADPTVAADLLARAVVARAREIAAAGEAPGDRLAPLLDRLRAVSQQQAPEGPADAEAPAGHQAALADGLVAAAAVEADAHAAADLLREAAALRRAHLADSRGAADALARALVHRPDDGALVAELDATLREAGDYAQLVSAYELHLSALEGPRRAAPLVELARLQRDVLGELHRARASFEEAIAADPARADELGPELVALPSKPANGEAGATSIDDELARAAALEAKGQTDAAIAHYEDAASLAPADPRPLRALERLHETRGDASELVSVLGRLLDRTTDRRARAGLARRRGLVYRDRLRREPEAYANLKEAFACAPDDPDVASALRSLAMVRGEWALAAELVYREIAAAADDAERGALHLELAMIYDEKLHDAEQALVSYEQALTLDADIPAAPRPLARLYELRGRHEDAAAMYEAAAAHVRDEPERGRLLRHAAMSAERSGDASRAERLYRLAAITGEDQDRRAALDALERLEGGADAGASPGAAADGGARGEGDPGYDAQRSRATEDEDWDALVRLVSARATAATDPAERADLYHQLGTTYERDLQDVNAAVGAYEQALAACPAHAAALDRLADIAYRRSDWVRARALYESIDADESELGASRLAYRRGVVAEVLGREPEARARFDEAVALDPEDREALAALARTALRSGDTAAALEAQQRLLAQIPPDQVHELRAARLQLAELAQRSGNAAGAIEQYELLLGEAPRSHVALSNLVSLHGASGDATAAAAALEQLIALTPSPTQRADLLFRLGELHRDAGTDPDLAADAYLKAIDLDPDHEPTLRRLLEYYWRIGDRTGLVEIARDLASRGALLSEATGLRSLSRVAVIAALVGDQALASSIAGSLGEGAGEDLGRALLDASRSGADAAELVVAALELSRASGGDLRQLADWLAARAGDDERDLIDALRRRIG